MRRRRASPLSIIFMPFLWSPIKRGGYSGKPKITWSPILVDLCPEKRNGYMHFLMHSKGVPKGKAANTQLSFYHLALALGFKTPYIEEKAVGRMVMLEPCLNTLDWLREVLWKDRNLIYGLYHETAFVVPAAWPDRLTKAFGLLEPPTPYEVACATLVEPHSSFWCYQRGWSNKVICSYSALLWWLLGLPEQTITTHLGIRGEGELYQHLALSIHHMMRHKRFATWACGIDLTPYCTNRFMHEVAVNFHMGKPLPKDAHGCRGVYRRAQERLFMHPFVKSQRTTGQRHGRLVRPVYRDGIIWKTVEEKQEWERGDTTGAARVQLGREKLAATKAKKPLWLKFPLFGPSKL